MKPKSKGRRVRKPRRIKLQYCGAGVTFSVDDKMSNIWVADIAPIDLKGMKHLRTWLIHAIKYLESKGRGR